LTPDSARSVVASVERLLAELRLEAAGADEVVTTLHGAMQRVREHSPSGMEEQPRAAA
jgi:hypothetical protein